MTIIEDLYTYPLFSGCSPERIQELFRKSANRLAVYKEGDLVALQGNECRSLYLLVEGEVHTFMTSDEGKELLVERMRAPQVLAPAFLYGSENHFPVSIKAVSECKFWILSKESFFYEMQENEPLMRNFLRIISDRSLFLSRKFKEFALHNLNTRVVGYLKQHHVIQNLQEVAFILGVARPSLSRALAMLVNQGIVTKEESGYVLCSSKVDNLAVNSSTRTL